MSILINGIGMPKNCRECPLETDYGTCGYYSLYVEAGHDSDYEKRRDDCPLTEIPPHGPLIDMDDFLQEWSELEPYRTAMELCEVIEAEPTKEE